MANEFVIKNGFESKDNSGVTGSLTVINGNVGIGTSDPDTAYLLHVSGGNVRIHRDSTKSAYIQYNNDIGSMYTGTDASGSFNIDSNPAKFGGKPDFVVDRLTGWVGLGTASVQAQLHVRYGDFGIETAAPAFLVNTSATDTDIFVVDYLRQVGIGKYPTGSKLDVSGSVFITGSLSISGSVIGSSGNTATSDALLQATLLYLSNNF